ncbi:MAG: hypothetical protein HFH03_12240 [Dorea sp.]|jgi:putative bacteriocin precursor|nr:hypothetical protein [Dorea sp.]
MKKLNKRYETSLKSVRAQKTCPCATKCIGCNGVNPKGMQSQFNSQSANSNATQRKLWS